MKCGYKGNNLPRFLIMLPIKQEAVFIFGTIINTACLLYCANGVAK